MITRLTGIDRGTARERRLAAAVWQARRRGLTRRVDLLRDAPSQVLAGVAAWRRMVVCARTGAERRGNVD